MALSALPPPPQDNSLGTGWTRWFQQLWSNVGKVQLSPTGPQVVQGAGAPGTLNLPSGSLYLRTDGGAGTSLYVREGGAWTAK